MKNTHLPQRWNYTNQPQSDSPPSLENCLLRAFSLFIALSTTATSYLDEIYALPLSGPFKNWHFLHNLALMALTHTELMKNLMVGCGEVSALKELATRPSENRKCGYKCSRFMPMYALKLLFIPYQAMSFPAIFSRGCTPSRVCWRI